jgi:hypothetical protein
VTQERKGPTAPQHRSTSAQVRCPLSATKDQGTQVEISRKDSTRTKTRRKRMREDEEKDLKPTKEEKEAKKRKLREDQMFEDMFNDITDDNSPEEMQARKKFAERMAYTYYGIDCSKMDFESDTMPVKCRDNWDIECANTLIQMKQGSM